MNVKAKEKIGFGVLLLATLLVVVPILLIIGLIISRGWSAITWEFLLAMPRDGMRAGGIFPAIVGTFYLVMGSIAFSLPIGVMAAIYLHEYAKDNLLTRIINLAIVNLAGISSVVFGLFGLSLFVSFCRFGVSILSGALTSGDHEPAGNYYDHAGSAARRAAVFPGGQFFFRRDPLADDPAFGIAVCFAGHPDRRDLKHRPGRGRDRAYLVHRGGVLSAESSTLDV